MKTHPLTLPPPAVARFYVATAAAFTPKPTTPAPKAA